MNILVAEDDKKLNDGIVLALKNPELTFTQCYNCRECMLELQKQVPDILILDINFPDGSGFDILKKAREENRVRKVIILTANNMETDIVSGLELGADDYITKPFSLMVLRARVDVQLRSLAQKQEDSSNDRVEIDNFSFDFSNMIYLVRGEVVELSKTEQKLLKALVSNRGNTLTRDRLLEIIWNGESEFVDEHALTVTVKRLRDKLKESTAGKTYIKTVYGIGYSWMV